MKLFEILGGFGCIAFLLAVLAVIYGWFANIFAIVHAIHDPFNFLLALRCLGVVVAPLGAALGLFV